MAKWQIEEKPTLQTHSVSSHLGACCVDVSCCHRLADALRGQIVKEKEDGKETGKAVDAPTKSIKIANQLDLHSGPYYSSLKRNTAQTDVENFLRSRRQSQRTKYCVSPTYMK